MTEDLRPRTLGEAVKANMVASSRSYLRQKTAKRALSPVLQNVLAAWTTLLSFAAIALWLAPVAGSSAKPQTGDNTAVSSINLGLRDVTAEPIPPPDRAESPVEFSARGGFATDYSGHPCHGNLAARE